ncbi:MAG: MFS transporter [Spirochaetales bacterium]|nr:MFS transporter [Spirochaetales bacterium]
MSQRSARISATVAVAIASFIGSVMSSAINVALPEIQQEFALPAVTLTWISTSFVLSNAVFLIAAGKIGDIYGRKKVFIGGIAVLAVTTLLCGVSSSGFSLILFRVVQGLGSAMINATTMAILSSVFPPHRRGVAIGIGVASVYTGLSFGPFLGGIITTALGWRWMFFLIAPVEVVPLLLTVIFVKEDWADAKGESFDLAGSLLYGVSLVLFMYGMTILPLMRALIFLLPGLIGLVLFIRHELKVRFPVLEVKLFRTNRVFAFSSVAALIHYSATYAITFLLSLFLQFSMGISPRITGTILVIQPVAQALLSPLAGRLSDRIEPTVLVSAGMSMVAAGLFLLSRLTSDTPLILVIIVLAFLGAGYALFSSPNTNAIMSSVEKKYYGLASGVVATMRSLGQVLSMGVTTIVFTLFLGDSPIGEGNLPAFNRSVRVSFLIFTVLCLAGVYFSSVRGRLDREKSPAGDE